MGAPQNDSRKIISLKQLQCGTEMETKPQTKHKQQTQCERGNPKSAGTPKALHRHRRDARGGALSPQATPGGDPSRSLGQPLAPGVPAETAARVEPVLEPAGVLPRARGRARASGQRNSAKCAKICSQSIKQNLCQHC